MIPCIYSLNLSDIHLTLFQGKDTSHGMHLDIYIFIQVREERNTPKCLFVGNFFVPFHTFSVFYNFKLIIYYFLFPEIHTLIRFLQFKLKCLFFSVLGFHPGYHTTFSDHGSLGSSWLWQTPRFLLFLMSLMALGIAQVSCRMFLNRNMSGLETTWALCWGWWWTLGGLAPVSTS